MSGREVTEREIRQRAEELGLDPDEAVESGIRGGWVKALWAVVRNSGIRACPEAGSRLSETKLVFRPANAYAATTTIWDGQYSVRVNLGIIEAIAECARTIASGVADPAIAGPPGAEPPHAKIGVRMAHVLGCLTSVAASPVATPEHSLPIKGEQWARGMTVAAVLFVLAHEAGHVIAEEASPDTVGLEALNRERRADSLALEVVRQMSGNRSDDEPQPSHPDGWDTLHFPSHLTLPAAAMFLSFEGLRQRAVASAAAAAAAATPGGALDSTASPVTLLIDATTGSSHPSAYERLLAIHKAALADPERDAAHGVQVIIDGFDSLLPFVQRNLPEWVLDGTELRDWFTEENLDPDQVPPGLSLTYQQIYFDNLLRVLREAGERGHVLDSDLLEIRDLATRMPRTVINALAAARAGVLLPPADPTATKVYAVAEEVAQRIEPAILRYALASDPAGIQRQNLLQ